MTPFLAGQASGDREAASAEARAEQLRRFTEEPAQLEQLSALSQDLSADEIGRQHRTLSSAEAAELERATREKAQPERDAGFER